MTRAASTRIRIRPATHRFNLPQAARFGFFGVFLIQFVLVWTGLWLSATPWSGARWPEAWLVALATATTLASLARQLPLQNVLLAALLIAVLAGAVQSLGALKGIPFGPYVYGEALGRRLFDVLPWPVPLIWIVAILSSRGTAGLILRPWQGRPGNGLWVLGVTTVLVVLLDFGLEPFATNLRHYWSWRPTAVPSDWFGAPWVNFLGWAVTGLATLIFVTPALINKKPVRPPPDYHPLTMWLLLNLLFLTGAVVQRLWLAAALVLGQSIVVTAFALRGASRVFSVGRGPGDAILDA